MGEDGPSDSALAAARGGRLRPPSRGPARGALRFSGPVLGRAPLGAIRPRRYVAFPVLDVGEEIFAKRQDNAVALGKHVQSCSRAPTVFIGRDFRWDAVFNQIS